MMTECVNLRGGYQEAEYIVHGYQKDQERPTGSNCGHEASRIGHLPEMRASEEMRRSHNGGTRWQWKSDAALDID